MDEIKDLGVKIVDEKFNKDECLRILDSAIAREATNLHFILAKKVNPKGNSFVSINKFKTIDTLKTGDSFGEIALVTNHRRGATIRSITECKFATLSRLDYVWSIGQEKKQ